MIRCVYFPHCARWLCSLVARFARTCFFVFPLYLSVRSFVPFDLHALSFHSLYCSFAMFSLFSSLFLRFLALSISNTLSTFFPSIAFGSSEDSLCSVSCFRSLCSPVQSVRSFALLEYLLLNTIYVTVCFVRSVRSVRYDGPVRSACPVRSFPLVSLMYN